MSPHVISIPLSGGDRKHLKKQLASARATQAALAQRAASTRKDGEKMLRAAQEKLRAADRFDCLAWNAILFCGETTENSPTIGTAIGAGLPLLRVCCYRCSAERNVDLRTLRRSHDTRLHLLENKLACESCNSGHGRPQRAHIVCLDEDSGA